MCVIDVHTSWLHSWKKNFETLDIQFLRSPALAHPNLFDQNALLAYAMANGRAKELFYSSCCKKNKLLAMGQSQMSLWKLPSTRLFVDFCEDLADTLPHDYVQGEIRGITMNSSMKMEHLFRVEIDSGRTLSTKAVILATGPAGRQIIPAGLQSLTRESRKLCFWNELDQVLPEQNIMLVVGGGLTAVQVVLKLLKLGKTCILCSRRPLIEKHFDVGLEWFELRTANACMSDFYHQEIGDRLSALKEARGGGSVPPSYMREVEKAEKSGKLLRVAGTVHHNRFDEEGNDRIQVVVTTTNEEKKSFLVDQVVLACGFEADCRQNPAVKSVLESWPIPIHGGLPSVTEDLRWKENLPLYVVGSLGALNTGPDAGNLMGIRRAAQLVANGLDCRCWLREKALANPFEAFLLGDSSDDSSTDSDSESFLG